MGHNYFPVHFGCFCIYLYQPQYGILNSWLYEESLELHQWPPTTLAPETSFLKDSFSMEGVGMERRQ